MRLNAKLHKEIFNERVTEVPCRDTAFMHTVLTDGDEPGWSLHFATEMRQRVT